MVYVDNAEEMELNDSFTEPTECMHAESELVEVDECTEYDESWPHMTYVDAAEEMESKDFVSVTELNTLKMDEHTMQLLLMAHVKKAPDETTWFLDSGCSNHMSGHKDFFSELDENFHRSIKLGDNCSIDVMGKGRIHLQVNNISQVISEVFYIPDLKNNLLSIGQLQKRGLAILFQNNKCKVYHPERDLIIDTNMTLNRMFIILAKIQLHEKNCFITLALSL